MHCHPRKYFADLENDPLRTDPYEIADLIHQPKDIVSLRVTHNATGKEFVFGPKQLAGPFVAGRTGPRFNLFCMYGLSEIPASGSIVDPKNFKFGDSYVIVTNTQEFLNRINAATETVGLAVV